MQEKDYEKFKKISPKKTPLVSEQILATNNFLRKKYTKITMENLYVDIGT